MKLKDLWVSWCRPVAPAVRVPRQPVTAKNPLPMIPAEALSVSLPFRICVIDTETTGTASDDRIVSWAVLYTGGGAEPVLYQGLIAPEVRIGRMAESIHGISNEYAQQYGKKPRDGIEDFTSVLPQLAESTPIAGQNVQFDLGFIEMEAGRYGLRYPSMVGGILDTMHLGRDLRVSATQRCSLDDLYRRYGVALDGRWRHTAAGDVLGVARVLESMWRTERLAGLGLGDLRRNGQQRGMYLRAPVENYKRDLDVQQ